MSNSKYVYSPPTDSKSSKLVTYLQEGLKQLDTILPETKGMFGHEFSILTSGVILESSQFDFEFDIEFDDNLETDEATVTIYNLSDSTINKFKYDESITIKGGYKGDTGVLFIGNIRRVTTKREGADKVTTILAFDCYNMSQYELTNTTYTKNTKASYILKNLLSKTKLPIAAFNVKRDWTYKDETKVEGILGEQIKKYSDVCGISVYIHKGEIYARQLSEGDNLNFKVCSDTGMISVESFQEEKTVEDYKDVINGFKIKMILQHRMKTAGIVNLQSKFYQGTYRIRSGKHSYDGTSATTEIEVV